MFVFVHIPPIFSVLLTYSLKINSFLCCGARKFGYCPLELCPELCGLTKIATTSRSYRQQNSSTVQLADDSYDDHTGRTYFITCPSTVCSNLITLTCCGIVPTVVATVDKISTDTARRAVRLQQQSSLS